MTVFLKLAISFVECGKLKEAQRIIDVSLNYDSK